MSNIDKISLGNGNYAAVVTTYYPSKNIHINFISSHLDVSDNTAQKRLKEAYCVVKYIYEKDLKNVVWLGDFNAMMKWQLLPYQIRIYNEAFKDRCPHLGIDQPYALFEYLKDEGFADAFDACGHMPPLSSCWTNRVVDHVLVYKLDDKIQLLDTFFHHCDFSDHLPLFLDFRMST